MKDSISKRPKPPKEPDAPEHWRWFQERFEAQTRRHNDSDRLHMEQLQEIARQLGAIRVTLAELSKAGAKSPANLLGK